MDDQEFLLQRLRARVRQLAVLNRVAPLLQDLQAPLTEVMFELVTNIPSAWQYPDVAAVRLTYDGREMRSPHYRPTSWALTGEFVTGDGKTGALEVCYLEERPEADSGPFLIEELSLINSLAQWVGTHLERRRVAAQLAQEERLAEVARVLGSIGHDLKNMLMPIVIGVELLESGLNDYFRTLPAAEAERARPAQRLLQEAGGMVRNNSRRVHERVREIADAVKGRTSPPQFAPCEVGAVVGEVYESLRFFANERKVALAGEDLERLPTIEADERRLFNALYNLANNAIQAVPRGGSVTIRGRAAGDWIELSVADTGRGMSPEVRDSLFTARAISSRAGGTGLGTKIAKDVVDAHGGSIRVDSEVGAGATFTMRLPVRRAKGQRVATPPPL